MSKKNAASNILDIMQHMKSKEEVEKEVHNEIEATNATLEQIRTARQELAAVLEAYLDAKNKLQEAKEEVESIMKAYDAAAKSSDNVVSGITNAILDARKVTFKVGLTDEAKQQLKAREEGAVSDFDKSLAKHKGKLNELFIKQWKELDDIRGQTECVHIYTKTFWWMFGIWFVGVFATILMVFYNVYNSCHSHW